MKIINIIEAKTNFFELIDAAIAGKETIIAMNEKPVAKIVPISPSSKRKLGVLKGKIRISKDFDDTLSEDFLFNT